MQVFLGATDLSAISWALPTTWEQTLNLDPAKSRKFNILAKIAAAFASPLFCLNRAGFPGRASALPCRPYQPPGRHPAVRPTVRARTPPGVRAVLARAGAAVASGTPQSKPA